MKKYLTLLVFFLIAIFAAGASTSPDIRRELTECNIFYEWSTAGSVGGYNFTGVTDLAGSAKNFDTPLFDEDPTDDIMANSPPNPTGRASGSFFPIEGADLTTGVWNGYFFDTDSWIAANFGFGTLPYPKTVTGGTGELAGFEGTLDATVISEDPFVLKWYLCDE